MRLDDEKTAAILAGRQFIHHECCFKHLAENLFNKSLHAAMHAALPHAMRQAACQRLIKLRIRDFLNNFLLAFTARDINLQRYWPTYCIVVGTLAQQGTAHIFNHERSTL